MSRLLRLEAGRPSDEGLRCLAASVSTASCTLAFTRGLVTLQASMRSVCSAGCASAAASSASAPPSCSLLPSTISSLRPGCACSSRDTQETPCSPTPFSLRSRCCRGTTTPPSAAAPHSMGSNALTPASISWLRPSDSQLRGARSCREARPAGRSAPRIWHADRCRWCSLSAGAGCWVERADSSEAAPWAPRGLSSRFSTWSPACCPTACASAAAPAAPILQPLRSRCCREPLCASARARHSAPASASGTSGSSRCVSWEQAATYAARVAAPAAVSGERASFSSVMDGWRLCGWGSCRAAARAASSRALSSFCSWLSAPMAAAAASETLHRGRCRAVMRCAAAGLAAMGASTSDSRSLVRPDRVRSCTAHCGDASPLPSALAAAAEQTCWMCRVVGLHAEVALHRKASSASAPPVSSSPISSWVMLEVAAAASST
mmetsp:Transcript_15688/g.39140  ORF Transcript_15688/g.39140 Transcript_15688/m.39140 type:complete len:435 (-) Transcript_15688:301-1605(-)